jgi:mono/diheme cytochrome c family protein
MIIGQIIKIIIAAATPVVVALAAFFICKSAHTKYTGQPGSDRYEAGRKIFETRQCGLCHSLEPSDFRNLGPSLHEIGKVGGQRKPGMTAAEYILESIVDPGAFRAPGTVGGMPEGLANGLSQEELLQLVGFLATRGASVNDDEIRNLKVPELKRTEHHCQPEFDFDKVKRGEELFSSKGQCNACHSLRAEPSFTLKAPSLLDIGSVPAADLRRAIVEPNSIRSLAYRQAVATMKNGLVLQGRLVGQSDTGISVLRTGSDGTMETVLLRFSAMATGESDSNPLWRISDISSMPSMKGVLTDQEIDALVAFLRNRHGGGNRR